MKLSKINLLISAAAVLFLCFSAYVVLKTEKGKPVRSAISRQWLILTGKLVNVGEHRLRIECKGTGNPTVVMDAGLAQTRQTWNTLRLQEIEKFTRVCTYDRAGLGDSDKPKVRQRTSEKIVKELHTLLQESGENKPFLLVGHSFGGMNIRLYASLFPEEVAGLVMIDSIHEDQCQPNPALAPEERDKYIAQLRDASSEHVDILESCNEIRRAPPLKAVPLVVLSSDSKMLSQDRYEQELHNKIQTAMAQLVPGSKLIVVEGSGHFIHQDRPDVVFNNIRDLYENTKKPIQ